VNDLTTLLLGHCIRHVRRASSRLAQEHGVSLLIALIALAVLSTVGGGVAVYTSSNLRHSYTDKSSASAYQLAEAGLAEALSRLQGAEDPTDTTILPSTTVDYPSYGGSATYSGTAVSATDRVTWTITSTGTVGNPARSKTLTQTALVRGLVPGADLGSWSRFYSDSTTSCLTIDTVAMPAPIATRGDLCLVNGGSITGSSTSIDVGKRVFISGPQVTGSAHLPSAGTGWTNPTNVYSNNGVYATNAISASTTGSGQDTTNFNLGLPTGAQILGIKVSLERLSSACCNAVQTISETGGPTGGTFKLRGTPPWGSSTISSSINYNASASSVTTTLAAIYGTGNVSCTGGPLPAAVVCTFQGNDDMQPIVLMSLYSKSLTGGTNPTPVFTNTTTGSNGALKDDTVQLLKAGAPVGSNKASSSTWGTSSSTITYGSSSDLWGTTWTAADLNASDFGLRFTAKNVAAATATASLDWVTVTVTYNDDTNGIGTVSTPIHDATIGETCTYNGQGAHTPCTSADHVNASSIVMSTTNDDLVMPVLDLGYWFQNARPGPKHPCTNAGNNLSPLVFDNDNSATSNDSLQFDNSGAYDITPTGRSYDCEVVENGVTLGRLKWDYQTHVLNIGGTIFFDGDVRFDDDGQLVHYQGRGLIYAAGDVEFDELVCAGGTGTTLPAASCANSMSSWDPSKNYLTLMANGNAEYDQGGTGCYGLPSNGVTCGGSHPQSGFQGVVSAQGTCTIHERFKLSGPVICGRIVLPYESDGWPTYYSFPSLSELVDGQKYGDIDGANAFEVQPGPQSG
jgi:Tfp pilus assembly protein PilX